jgi:FtsZ-interacting cell division protein ZipA
MSAVMEPGNSPGVTPASAEAVRVSTRAAVVALVIVVLAFGAAYAIGSMAKKTSTTTPAGQLAPASPLRGQSSVQIAVPGAAGAIPALAHVAKPKPAHHAQAATQAAASVSQSQSTSAQSSSTQSVAQQPVVQQPIQQQPVQPQQPVHQPQPQQPVVVVHGG